MSVKFKNVEYGDELIENGDLLVVCLSYEERSFFIADKCSKKQKQKKLIAFTLNDYPSFGKKIVDRIKAIQSCARNFYISEYDGDDSFQQIIVESIIEIQKKKDEVNVVIDYSSMPRGWYCGIPKNVDKVLRKNDKITFLYSEGKYDKKLAVYQSAGIEAYRVYDGKASLYAGRSRIHMLGVGYDGRRTLGVLSVTDPQYYVVIDAYDPEYPEVYENVLAANTSVIEHAPMTLSLYVSDMEFIVAKVKGLINEFLSFGNNDVILVPDGPKPLIFAMSIMPWLFNTDGVTCLHVKRNNSNLKRNNVKANGKVIGFYVLNEDNESFN